jgi:hypothetical protein
MFIENGIRGACSLSLPPSRRPLAPTPLIARPSIYFSCTLSPRNTSRSRARRRVIEGREGRRFCLPPTLSPLSTLSRGRGGRKRGSGRGGRRAATAAATRGGILPATL